MAFFGLGRRAQIAAVELTTICRLKETRLSSGDWR